MKTFSSKLKITNDDGKGHIFNISDIYMTTKLCTDTHNHTNVIHASNKTNGKRATTTKNKK